MVAFSAEYAGNTDVYVVPVERRRAEAPDVASRRRHGAGLDARRHARSCSPRAAPPRRRAATPRFWTVPAEGGVEEPMALPRGYQGKISPDGTPHRLSHEQLVGRRAPQLSRRPEPPDLDRRPQDATTSSRRRGPTRRTSIRCGSATPSTSSPIATASANVWSYRHRRRKTADAGDASSPTST